MTHLLKKRDARAGRQKTRTLFGQRHKKRIQCECTFSPKTASLFATLIARAVRSKKYVDCANWDKSVKLGT